jgi:hypothetical protein
MSKILEDPYSVASVCNSFKGYIEGVMLLPDWYATSEAKLDRAVKTLSGALDIAAEISKTAHEDGRSSISLDRLDYYKGKFAEQTSIEDLYNFMHNLVNKSYKMDNSDQKGN